MIADLERDLARCIREYVDGRQEALTDALSLVSLPSAFPGLVRDIMSDADRFADVVRRSVVHPNGFAKIVLLTSPGYRLRLHVWRDGGEAAADFRESIHNHRWDFAATVVAGAYRHQEFQESEGGTSFFGYCYRPAEDGRSYRLVPVGTQTLRCVFDARLAQGCRYTMSSMVLHRVVPDFAQPPVSLVLEGPHQPAAVDVFTEHDLELRASVPFVSLSVKSLRRHLSAVAALPAFSLGSS
ncbi:hypothetical protein GCM10023335_57110 [Streptomyces siamensis]|uniref:Uncharacterized protein n=2 Tax=Streptomyces siamensis TaxID=1274986 RepID=A0ABP9J8D7_9ACTN